MARRGQVFENPVTAERAVEVRNTYLYRVCHSIGLIRPGANA
jgi:hypothetical protein